MRHLRGLNGRKCTVRNFAKFNQVAELLLKQLATNTRPEPYKAGSAVRKGRLFAGLAMRGVRSAFENPLSQNNTAAAITAPVRSSSGAKPASRASAACRSARRSPRPSSPRLGHPELAALSPPPGGSGRPKYDQAMATASGGAGRPMGKPTARYQHRPDQLSPRSLSASGNGLAQARRTGARPPIRQQPHSQPGRNEIWQCLSDLNLCAPAVCGSRTTAPRDQKILHRRS